MDIYTFTMDREGSAWLDPIEPSSWNGRTYHVIEMEPVRDDLIRFRVESRVGNSCGTQDCFAKVNLANKGVIEWVYSNEL